ncbi:response regulator transcription factor [Parapedobacter indicus]|uniref:DNA-binding response regulator, NarL/FixJ family, contains REC and HTH domains n=1 Tax=Parapedobacter indicus TaxID=1477437 RepID=A0A1I3RWM2_9SPHI|nr:DNA-binding response regulator [Parapedobacter indicus]PPK99984.1 LuxR family two component transcriptional regulator [Parapedobacter indicus]SFJ49721.1 DNA-binding response regulator, NarL/FixJ family, contains REC and HTH domains [Parapedobacter indicus]
MKKKVLILEDEIIIANSIQLHLQANGYDAEIATNPVDAEALFGELPFDILLCDINLNHETDGITFVENVVRDSVPVVFLTAYSDLPTLKRAEVTCPYAYLIKPFNKDQLLVTLNLSLVHARKKFLHTSQRNTSIPDNIELTARELEILNLLAQSKTTDEISAALFISSLTVATHRRNIFRKTQTRGLIELISLAVEKGWI